MVELGLHESRSVAFVCWGFMVSSACSLLQCNTAVNGIMSYFFFVGVEHLNRLFTRQQHMTE